MSFGVSGNNPYSYTFTTSSVENAGSAETTGSVQTTGSAQTAGSVKNTVTYEPTAYVPDYQKENDKALWWDAHTSIGAVSSAHVGSCGSAVVGEAGSVKAPTIEEVREAVQSAAASIASAAAQYHKENGTVEGFTTTGLPYGFTITTITASVENKDTSDDIVTVNKAIQNNSSYSQSETIETTPVMDTITATVYFKGFYPGHTLDTTDSVTISIPLN